MKFTPILTSVVAISSTVGGVLSFTASIAVTSPQRGLALLPRFATISSRSRFARSSSSSLLMSSTEEFVKTEISNNKVIVFSKSYCPYCTATKELFKTIGVNAKIYEIDTMKDGDNIQSTLLQMTGQRTVPSVFINEQHIGGNDKTQAAYASGTLTKLLDSAGVSYNIKN